MLKIECVDFERRIFLDLKKFAEFLSLIFVLPSWLVSVTGDIDFNFNCTFYYYILFIFKSSTGI